MAKRTCTYPSCDRVHFARDYCKPHYEEYRRWGWTWYRPPRPTPTERFFAKVNKGVGDACWLWTGAISDTGYGVFSLGTREMGPCGAHVWSYKYHVGPVPPGLELDHLCRVRRCVNPNHLEAVTHRVNMLRGNSPCLIAARANECTKGHSMVDAYVYRRGGKVISRRCRVCERVRKRARLARKRAELDDFGGVTAIPATTEDTA